VEEPTPSDLDEKSRFLLSQDLAMMSSAARYDLDDESQRFASNDALVRLFFSLCRHIEPDLFIEAGAWEASASRRAARILPDARVVAFEANPYLYRSYKQINDQAGIEYLHNAVSDQPGTLTFNVLRNDSGEAIVNGRSSILKRAKKGDEERGFEEHAVEGVALDAFLGEHTFEKAALWIDVEGATGKVLHGARRLLAKAALVIVEVEELEWWGDEHWRRDRVESFLYDVGLVPVARDFQYKHQYNLVFVRAGLLRSSSPLRWTLARFASQAYAPHLEPMVPDRNAAARAAGGLRRRFARSALLRRAFGKVPL
jgi:FkbM family methyltransferase